MDEIHFAPPKQPWLTPSFVGIYRGIDSFRGVSERWCEMVFVHPQYDPRTGGCCRPSVGVEQKVHDHWLENHAKKTATRGILIDPNVSMTLMALLCNDPSARSVPHLWGSYGKWSFWFPKLTPVAPVSYTGHPNEVV